MAKASPNQAWLWHRRLSHLNFDYINLLSKKDVMIWFTKVDVCQGLTMFSYKMSKEKKFIQDQRTALSKEETVLLLRLLERCFQLLNFLCSFGLKQLQPHAILKIDLSLSQHMRKRHITSSMTEKISCNTFYIFGRGTCYLTRDGENLDKMKEKGDMCILVGYSTQSKGYRVYNKITRLIVESIHLKFDEIKEMSETSVANDTSYHTTVPSKQELDLLFGLLYDEFSMRVLHRIPNTVDKVHPLLHVMEIHEYAKDVQLNTDPEMFMFALPWMSKKQDYTVVVLAKGPEYRGQLSGKLCSSNVDADTS
ncbi:retrovirus-related pol polyprotein from transposon TNT 1-94 [Tanacetum coccineum]